MIRKNNQQYSHNYNLALADKKHSEEDREGSFIIKDSFDFDVLVHMGR